MVKHILLLVFFSFVVNGYGQSIDTEFGKNRVQYQDEFKYWDKYDSKNFTVYWYGKGRYIAQAAVQMAEYDHDEIRRLIEHKINDRIGIVVYHDIKDLKQSNIGSEEAFNSKSGETKIVGNKMFVYFNGNHQDLRKQIREGIASVYLSSMIFGSNLQEILQNAVLLDLPEWYTKGLVSFAGDSWNIFIEDEFRDVLARDKKMWNFKKIAVKHPKVAGHSFWNFISQTYGKSSISNLIYLTKISRDLKSSFQFALDTPLETLWKEWGEYYTEQFAKEEGKFSPLKEDQILNLSNKKYNPISALALNNDGSQLAYVTNKLGKIRLKIKDLKSGQEKTIFKYGFKNGFQATDFDFPQLAWHPSKNELTYTHLNKNNLYIKKYDAETDETIEQLLPGIFQRVYSLNYLDDRYYVFSGATEGLSDLYLYDSKFREVDQITNDYFDDLDAIITNYKGKRGVLFSSNRTIEHILPARLDTTLPIGNYDLFFLPLPDLENEFDVKNIGKTLTRVTNSAYQSERYPIADINSGHIAFLDDQSGIINSYVLDVASDNIHAISNHPRNIIRHALSADGQTYISTLYNDGQYQTYKYESQLGTTVTPHVTDLKKVENVKVIEEIKAVQEEQNTPKVKSNLKFQSRFEDPPVLKEIQEEDSRPNISINNQGANDVQTSMKAVEKFDHIQITAAGLKFKVDNLTARLDNEVLFEGLDLFGGQNPEVAQIPTGFLAKASITDLFEDHKLEGGVRIPTSFNGSEFFLTYDDKKKLLDRRVALYRRAINEGQAEFPDPSIKPRKETILGMYQLRYPFSIFSRVQATGSLRFDRAYLKSVNDPTFNEPFKRDKRVGLRLDYVFDNTFQYALNTLHGTRFKVYVEAFNQFELDLIDGFDFDYSKGFTGIFGFDARHYIPVLKHSVLAIRGAGAASMGSAKAIYYLGNVNKTLFNSFDRSVPIPEGNFAFKMNANHLRGFKSNIRNGSNFLLSNIELRVAPFKYLYGKDRGPSVLKNLQLVGFTDAGLAWHGLNPYGSDNPINTSSVETKVIRIDINYFRNPIVYSYGFGVRTKLLGYFLKLDYAYGIETKQVQDPMIHLSMGLDF